MKTVHFIIGFIIICIESNAQFTINLSGIETKSAKKVLLKEIVLRTEYSGNTWNALIEIDGFPKDEEIKALSKYQFTVNNIKEFWLNQALINSVYESLTKYGPQYDLRKEWEEEALQYLYELEQRNLTFNDSYLENYIYSLAYKLYPGSINDGRPGLVNVKIMLDNLPNAFIFPNGTLIITTGLLSTINSEQELIGVLSHEISHFVLDHSTINLNKAIQRQKAAEFWSAFATGLAAASEIYMASQNEYYVPGALTYSTAILSYTIASAFTERLGLQYSREQEFAADKCAVELMKYIDIDPSALSSALSKIRDYCFINGNYFALSGKGTHPSLEQRINVIGKPSQFNSISYDKLISFVNSTNAIIEFNNKHFNACQKLVDRNINAGIPIEDDYILKAITNLYLYDNDEKNLESLDLINKAKELNVVPTLNIDKQEALVLIRLKKYPEAIIALESYNDKLEQENLKVEKYSWSSKEQYLENERNWTAKMIYKVKSL
jgi:Zn-dependent protease with chaperone function